MIKLQYGTTIIQACVTVVCTCDHGFSRYGTGIGYCWLGCQQMAVRLGAVILLLCPYG